MLPLFIMFGLLFSLQCNFPAFSATNGSALMTDQVLVSGDKLISSNSKFALGFFQIGRSKTSDNTTLLNWYLGIWFNKIPKFITVWIANRDKPITDPIFKLSKSFDHPTDVLLSGAKLGRNKVTGQKYSLISKKNSEDPAPALYCMELDSSGSKQFNAKVCNSSMVYFSTEQWNGRYFNALPEMSGNVFLDSKFVDNDEEEYFTYTPFYKTVITICLLDVSGLIKQFLWVEELRDWEIVFFRPKSSCDVFSVCGPFTMCNDNALPLCNCMKGFSVKSPKDWELGDRQEGCTKNTLLDYNKNKSTTGLTDKFFAIPSVTLPYDAHSMETVTSAHKCMQVCLRKCSCTAYSYGKNGCSLWHYNIINVKQYNDTADTNEEILYLRLAAAEVQSWEHNKRTIIGVVAGVSVSAFSFLVFVLLLLICRSKRRSCGHPMNKIKDGVGTVACRYAHLQHATKKFSEKLGGGSFGSVFKGILSNSTTIAVKMLDGARQSEKQFRAEQWYNSKLEYKVTDSHRGCYESCHDCIIHCDIKPENILLDALFVPKVAHFGMAKLPGRDFSRVLTTRGTIGYLAPEWISGVAITQKVDVYSFGMVLLEIISGRRNTLGDCKSNNDQAVYFPVQAAHKLLNGDVGSLIDKNLHGDINMEEVEIAFKVACWSIQDDDFNPPTMGGVVQVLEGLIELDMPQVPRLLETILSTPATTCM
uniref:Non-specific serine/threonine protein kinase n=1 Tax=Leersia perrieri TaxID=77586 RepID=A0A0D9W2T8_9ORYZ